MKEGYTLFKKTARKDGVLVVKKNVDNELSPTLNGSIYSLNLDTEYAKSVRIENAQFIYDVEAPVEPLSSY